MLIHRNGVYKNVTEHKFNQVFEKLGYGIVKEKKEKQSQSLAEREKLTAQADELNLEYTDKTTNKKLEKMIEDAKSSKTPDNEDGD